MYYLEFDYSPEVLLEFYDTFFDKDRDIDLNGMGICADLFMDMANDIKSIVEHWPEEYRERLRNKYRSK